VDIECVGPEVKVDLNSMKNSSLKDKVTIRPFVLMNEYDVV
jgi:hypothetical protein